MTKPEKQRFRVLSEEQFNGLAPEEKLAYLSAAFRAAVNTGDPVADRRKPASTQERQQPANPKPKKK